MTHALPRRTVLTGGAVFVASDAVTFVALLCAAASLRSQGLEWPAAHTSTGLLVALTVLLLAGSVLLRARVLFGVAAVGLLFVAGEAWEWRALLRSGEGPSVDLRHASLFVVTGLHALHVAVGAVYALGLAVRRKTSDVLSIYWAALDVAWVGIWLVVYR